MVPKKAEILGILRADHRHDGHNGAESRLTKTYHIPNLRELLGAVSGLNCQICAKFRPIQKIPSKPIVTSRRCQLVMFDLWKMPVPEDDGSLYVLTVIDHFTKYVWAEKFKTKEKEPIAAYLANIFSTNSLLPERWHADNGGEFVNDYIDAARLLLGRETKLMGKFLPYSHGLPRNPQCQGLVERMNRTLKNKIAKLLDEAGYDRDNHSTWAWGNLLLQAVMQVNSGPIALYGNISPYTMMFGGCQNSLDCVARLVNGTPCQWQALPMARLWQALSMAWTRLGMTRLGMTRHGMTGLA